MASKQRPRIRRTGPFDWERLARAEVSRSAQVFAFDGGSSQQALVDHIGGSRRNRRSEPQPEEHETLALDLEQFVSAQGERWAKRVRGCNNPKFFPKWKCKWRACPTCSKQYHRAARAKLIDAMTDMVAPQLCLVQVFTKRIDDWRELSSTITMLYASFRRLWKRKVLRPAESAAGFVEIAPTPKDDAWNIHAHLVVDTPHTSVDWEAVNKAWKSMIGGRAGDFLCQGAARSREGIATYITKVASYSPRGGILPLPVLETLLRGLYSRRLPIIRHHRTSTKRVDASTCADRSCEGPAQTFSPCN
jgi:hypothetical protein